MDLDPRAKPLLVLDGAAGALVGLVVLALHPIFASLYGLAVDRVLVIGAANLGYGCYSGTLALRWHRGRLPSVRSIRMLVIANALWACLCVVLLGLWWSQASWIGLAAIGLEGLFVGGLAAIERRVLLPAIERAAA